MELLILCSLFLLSSCLPDAITISGDDLRDDLEVAVKDSEDLAKDLESMLDRLEEEGETDFDTIDTVAEDLVKTIGITEELSRVNNLRKPKFSERLSFPGSSSSFSGVSSDLAKTLELTKQLKSGRSGKFENTFLNNAKSDSKDDSFETLFRSLDSTAPVFIPKARTGSLNSELAKTLELTKSLGSGTKNRFLKSESSFDSEESLDSLLTSFKSDAREDKFNFDFDKEASFTPSSRSGALNSELAKTLELTKNVGSGKENRFLKNKSSFDSEKSLDSFLTSFKSETNEDKFDFDFDKKTSFTPSSRTGSVNSELAKTLELTKQLGAGKGTFKNRFLKSEPSFETDDSLDGLLSSFKSKTSDSLDSLLASIKSDTSDGGLSNEFLQRSRVPKTFTAEPTSRSSKQLLTPDIVNKALEKFIANTGAANLGALTRKSSTQSTAKTLQKPARLQLRTTTARPQPKEDCESITASNPVKVCTPDVDTKPHRLQFYGQEVYNQEFCYYKTKTECKVDEELEDREVCTHNYFQATYNAPATNVEITLETQSEKMAETSCRHVTKGYGHVEEECEVIYSSQHFEMPVVEEEVLQFISLSYPEPSKNCITARPGTLEVQCYEKTDDFCVSCAHIKDVRLQVPAERPVQSYRGSCNSVNLTQPQDICTITQQVPIAQPQQPRYPGVGRGALGGVVVPGAALPQYQGIGRGALQGVVIPGAAASPFTAFQG